MSDAEDPAQIIASGMQDGSITDPNDAAEAIIAAGWVSRRAYKEVQDYWATEVLFHIDEANEARRERDRNRHERDEALEKLTRVRDLAEWHETKAHKARYYRVEIDGENQVMDKAAQVHEDAARRLRTILDATPTGESE